MDGKAKLPAKEPGTCARMGDSLLGRGNGEGRALLAFSRLCWEKNAQESIKKWGAKSLMNSVIVPLNHHDLRGFAVVLQCMLLSA